VGLRLPAVVLGAWAALGLAAACGTVQRPHELVDSNDGADGDDTGNSLIPDVTPPPPPCPKLIGPDGGVCACLDQPLLVDAPSIYFVLDRSGSMSDFNKWGTVQSVIGYVMESLGPRAFFGAAVFPASYDNTGCTPGNEVYGMRRGDSPAGTIGPATLAMLKTLRSIPAAGGTPTAATLAGLTQHLYGIGGKIYVILATDGGPNCDPSTQCPTSSCTYNIEQQMGCPSNGANCCDPKNGGTWLACLDSQPTLSAVQTLAKNGIPVYVVGLRGSDYPPYAALLDQLAVAGGTARGTEPQYYSVTNTDEASLQTALKKIAAKITGTCTFSLGNTPPDPTLVNVFLDDNLLPQQGTNGTDGWTIMGNKITIDGASCSAILDGDVLEVRIVAGCPTVIR
jgi:hypothetical protein